MKWMVTDPDDGQYLIVMAAEREVPRSGG